MGTVITTAEKRDLSRIALERPATLVVKGTPSRCDLLDVSLRGVLVRVPVRLELDVGQACAVAIPLDHASAVIRIQGTVTHRAQGKVGVCLRETDLESFAHLRRLLELNLGDEKLLRRELAALVTGDGA